VTGAAPASATRCANCGTELPPHALSCGACGTLVFSDKLKDLAATAEHQAAAGDLPAARATWEDALRWLPPESQQSAAIRKHIAELAKSTDGVPGSVKQAATAGQPWWKRGAAGIAAIVMIALSKLKFLLLGITKLGTALSMLAYAGVYWRFYGWPMAVGLVISIYIHEMGHVAEIRKEGLDAGAPLFVPGLGAFILLKTHIDDPQVDARIGLAGPVWGLGAALAAYAVYLYSGVAVWGAIAQLGAFINLFNLLPFWQLDGSRGFHALVTWQRWAVVAALGIAYYFTSQGLLFLIAIVAIYRAFQKPLAIEPDQRALATFLVLIGALSWLAAIPLPHHQGIGRPPSTVSTTKGPRIPGAPSHS
jgi:Zn-dependent protease